MKNQRSSPIHKSCFFGKNVYIIYVYIVVSVFWLVGVGVFHGGCACGGENIQKQTKVMCVGDSLECQELFLFFSTDPELFHCHFFLRVVVCVCVCEWGTCRCWCEHDEKRESICCCSSSSLISASFCCCSSLVGTVR